MPHIKIDSKNILAALFRIKSYQFTKQDRFTIHKQRLPFYQITRVSMYIANTTTQNIRVHVCVCKIFCQCVCIHQVTNTARTSMT